MIASNLVGSPGLTLTGLALKNFKAFGGDLQSAPMSRITLLYGPNAGGKSSVIQALLLLKQSEGNLPRGSVLAPQGEYVDLAGFRAMVHKHDEEREVEIDLQFKTQRHRTTEDVSINLTFSKDQQHGTDLPVLQKVGYEVKRADVTNLAIQLRLMKDQAQQSEETASFCWEDPALSAKSYARYVLQQPNQRTDYRTRRASATHRNEWDDLSEDMINVLNHVVFRARSSVLPIAPGLDEYGDRERERIESEFALLERKARELEREFHHISLAMDERGSTRRARGIRGLGGTADDTIRELRESGKDPRERLRELSEEIRVSREQEPGGLRDLRDFTERILYHSTGMDAIARSYRMFVEGTSYLGPILDDPRRFYLSWGGRRSTVGKRGEYTVDIISYDDQVRNDVNEWFYRFHIPYKIIDVRNVAANEITGTLSAMVLEDTRTGTIVTPVDVGFGISQILPVIVEGLAGTSHIVCVDQPEVHLHPRLQAEIADLMVECRSKQWIVETHSELLVRRILRRIAEGKIDASDVSVLYVDPPDSPGSGLGSTIKTMQIEQSGKFSSSTPWPDGFFEDGYREMMARIRAGG